MKSIANKPWKYLNLLFWLGLFLIAAGFTAGIISDKWGVIPLALLASGIAIASIWIVWKLRSGSWWKRRSTQASTNALLATVAVLAILGLINFLATRYHLRADLTETQLFTLAPESRELVRKLEKPVKVWIFDVAQNSQDRQLLENYHQQNPLFTYEYVDPQARPGLAEKFGVKDYGQVYLEYGNKRQLVQVVNVSDRLSEINLTNSLQKITSTATAKIYFLQGHGEHPLSATEDGMSQAVTALKNKNYTVAPLNLAEKSAVPKDANVVVVAGAKRGLLDSEVNALRDYLNRGGNLLLLVDPGTDPKVDSLLAQWGVKLDNRLAVDISGSVALGPAVAIVTDYGQHPITKDFGNGISFYRLARPLQITPVAGVEATPLLRTKPYPNSWAETDLKSENLQFNPNSDLPGPLTLGVALKRKLSTASASNSSSESRMVVIGDSDFATNGPFEQQLNADVFLNSVSWTSQQEKQTLSIRPKQPKNRRINLTQVQASVLTLSSLLILPLIGLAAAAILWWIRR
jgi:ABC-type uncharacterized transport system involved in gliding motility auxiliary subunit